MTREEAIEILKTDGCYECAVEQDSPYNCNDGGCEIREAYYMAIEALSADVRENVRGRWNPISTTSDAKQCSVCGFVFGDVKMIRMSPTTSVIQHAYDFAFCPMCGAEMRGET